jgi:plasmid stabilization system protein ParE
VSQLGAIAEYISVASPIYAEQVVEQLVQRLDQARRFPQSGRVVPEFERPDLREPPYRLIYRVYADTIEVVAVVHARRELRPIP